jgi:HK97 family phage portal protein
MVLEGGVTWEQISLSADDAQLLQSRGWSVEEVCRWFGVPPVLIGHSKDTTAWGTGIEQLMLGFVKFTLMPYLRRIEQAIGKQLLTPAERAQGLFAEFNLEGLLRGDSGPRPVLRNHDPHWRDEPQRVPQKREFAAGRWRR